jgi:transglutaminase-like putative cysteine protease
MKYFSRIVLVNCIIVTFFFNDFCEGASLKYKVADIPKNLLSNAKGVIRTNEVIFEISEVNKAIEKVTFAITILNNNGIDNSLFIKFYDKFLSIRKVKAVLYDQYGKVIKNLSYLDLKDYSAISGYSLYEDNRVKYLNPDYRATPFTVEYSYEISYEGLLFYPEWQVYDDYNISVQKSKFQIITPIGFKFRFLEKNIINKCSLSKGNGKSVYTWEADNLPAIRKETFSSSLPEYTPVVFSAPDDFEIGGYPGNLETWINFGNWINKLGENRNVLNKATKEKIQSILADKKSDYEKINTLYEYMQNKVRYVSIQVGIGGWQPIDAETVNRLSYGDCKALANYMKSLLEIAGIKSYYTLVMAGENATLITEGFPSSQFNHAIICVPVNKDTLWLECTDQHIPCGYLGTFTDDRQVLVTGTEGGKLVKTRTYSIEDNKKIRTAHVNLGRDGNAVSNIRTGYSGIFYDDALQVMLKDDSDKKKFILESIPISSFKLLSYSHTEKRSIIPSIFEETNLLLQNYGSNIGNRIIFNPNLIARVGDLPSRTKERIAPINIRRSLVEIDTVYFNVPDSFRIEHVPSKIVFSTKFGDYSSEISIVKNGLKYIRSFRLYKGIYSQNDFDSFVDFFERISVADENKVTLIQ